MHCYLFSSFYKSPFSKLCFKCFQELEEFCFRFALNHMTEVAQTEAFMALDELTVKNFIQRAAQHGAFKY